MRLASSSRRRPGFTLVEVIVAAGLCMLIMSVLAGAFAAGIDTFSLLKSTGELNNRLSIAEAILKRDLQAPHLETVSGEPLRVSQLRYDQYFMNPRPNYADADPFARPQPRGFFRLTQNLVPTAPALIPPPAANAVSYLEGFDPDGIPSTRAMSHTLQMAVRYDARRIERLSSALMPQPRLAGGFTPAETATLNQLRAQTLGNVEPTMANRFVSQWEEVAYFLSQTPTGTTAGGLPFYSLHRRARSLLPVGAPAINWSAFHNVNTDRSINNTGAPGMSVDPATQNLNTIADINDPNRRLGLMPSARGATGSVNLLAPLGTGEDILLNNVLSFEIRASWDGPFGSSAGAEAPFDDLPAFPSQPIGGQFPNGTGNPNFYRSVNSVNGPPLGSTIRVFDTWRMDAGAFQSWDRPFVPRPPVPPPPTPPSVFDPNPNFIPLPIRMKAIQIKLRIYDTKNKLTRQLTFVQDL